jgi:hypothetical protein
MMGYKTRPIISTGPGESGEMAKVKGLETDLSRMIDEAAEGPDAPGSKTKRGYTGVATGLGLSKTQLNRVRNGQAELPDESIPPLSAMTGIPRSVILYTVHKSILNKDEAAVLAEALSDPRISKPSTHTVATSSDVPTGYVSVRQAVANITVPSYSTYRLATNASRRALVESCGQPVPLSRPSLVELDSIPYICNQQELAVAHPPAKPVPVGATVSVRLTPREDAKNGDLVLVQFGTAHAQLLWYARREDGEGNIQETFSPGDASARVRPVLYRKDLPEKTLESQRLLIGVALRIINYPLDTLY